MIMRPGLSLKRRLYSMSDAANNHTLTVQMAKELQIPQSIYSITRAFFFFLLLQNGKDYSLMSD